MKFKLIFIQLNNKIHDQFNIYVFLISNTSHLVANYME